MLAPHPQTNSFCQKELARVRREHIGFVFQSSGNLPSALKARDQLELAARILGRRGRRSNDELLEAVGMAHRAEHRPATLSGGERQRIGIARALVGGPDLLLVDEPTAALDRNRAHEIVRLLAHECHELGVAGVMVTHDLEVIEHCDRVYDMVDGKLTARDQASWYAQDNRTLGPGAPGCPAPGRARRGGTVDRRR
ncbi:ABC transporter ATP-binding protein [Corynebacterium efficiens]|uniref:ABC transporter ATP-binding protein n=1 Tax=Corynebacterium efficiens TaxID=152794 RepID=UPI0038B3A16D